MIRFLMSLLLIHFSLFAVISCTTADSDKSAESQDINGAIDDAEAGGDSASSTPSKSAESDLEAELDNEDPVAPEAKAADQAPKDELSGELSEQDMQPAPQEEAPPVKAEEVPPAVADTPPPAQEKARIRDIHYMANSNGGTVVIETTQPVTYQSRMNTATQQFIIEIADVELPASLQRPYALKDFSSRFGSINAYQGSGSNTARIVIQMSSASSSPPMVQQEGTSLVVIPPSAPTPVASQPVATPEPGGEKAPQEGALGARTLDEFLTGNQRFYGRPINLQVKDADIRDVINFIAEDSGANIVMSEDVTGKISLKLRRIPWDQALVTVMRSRGFGYIRQGNVLRITTLKTLQEEADISNKLMESQKAIVPMVVQVIPISYSNLDDLVKSVTPFLSKDGKVVGDNRSSTLILTDKSDVAARIGKLVKTLDIAPAQVSIESKIVEAVEGFENFVGVNWGTTGSSVNLSKGGGANGSPIDLTNTITTGGLTKDFTNALPFTTNLQVGTLDFFGNLSATLSLAEHDSLAKVITAPRISTINREKSTITQQGENVTITTTRSDLTNTTSKTEKRTPFKLELSVTPQITSDGGVIMDLDVTRQFLGAVVDNETQAAPINTRSAKTKVLVRNGQTAVIGGIYSSDELESTRGVPGLMNIPVLGWLFKNKATSRSKNELLIFLTPRIISSDFSGSDQVANEQSKPALAPKLSAAN